MKLAVALLLALLGASTSNAFVMSMTKTGRTPVRMMAGSATVDSLKRVVLKDQATVSTNEACIDADAYIGETDVQD